MREGRHDISCPAIPWVCHCMGLTTWGCWPLHTFLYLSLIWSLHHDSPKVYSQQAETDGFLDFSSLSTWLFPPTQFLLLQNTVQYPGGGDLSLLFVPSRVLAPRSPRLRCHMRGFWWKLSSWLIEAIFSLCPHMAGRKWPSKLSGVFSLVSLVIRALIPSRGPHLHDLL